MSWFRDSLYIILIAFMVYGVPAPQCGPNETVNSCPAQCSADYCPKGQETRACPKPDSCPPPACKCIFNYRRADNGTCIPTVSCPPFDCPNPQERYVACPPYCPSDDCNQATKNGECPYTGLLLPVVECQPACRCVPGYWRKNGFCVPYDQCG